VQTYGIAIRRQLSEAHPLFKLLIPHTRYTMDINKRAREKLIKTGGVTETNFTPGEFAMRVRGLLLLKCASGFAGVLIKTLLTQDWKCTAKHGRCALQWRCAPAVATLRFRKNVLFGKLRVLGAAL
jgi:hypothetical protein